MKRLAYLLLITALGLSTIVLGGCGDRGTSIDVRGSDTMVNLGAAWAEAYMAKNKDITIAVQGGGSGTGITNLTGSNCDIAQASRAIKPSEMDQGRQAGFDIQEYIVAYDGVAIVVHPSNPVTELTLSDLGRIFRGEVGNWETMGGNDGPVVVLSRDTASGTHVFIKEMVVAENNTLAGAEYGPAVQFLPSTTAIVTEVAQNPHAIGYIGLGYLSPELTAIAVKNDETSPGIVPSVATVKDESYGIARPLYLYLAGEPEGAVKDYLDWILGTEGQAVVGSLGFVPVK